MTGQKKVPITHIQNYSKIIMSPPPDTANLSLCQWHDNKLRQWRYLSGKCMVFQLSLKLDLDWGEGADTANLSCQGSDYYLLLLFNLKIG